MSARLIEVIEVKVLRGKGKESDPSRVVTEYWSVEGELLAVRDEWADEQRASSGEPDHV